MNPVALLLVLVFAGFQASAYAQVLTNTSDATLNSVIAFGTLTPGSSNTPSTTSIQFRIRSTAGQGYQVRASLASFTVNMSSPASGGVTISAADIGIAVTGVDASGSNVLKPRTDSIGMGFNYNPASVTAINGISSFAGVVSGQARLDDLASSIKILSGPKIANSQSLNNNNFLTVTITLGVLREYFTPASFTAVINLTVANGQT